MLSLEVDVEGVITRLETAALRADDLAPALARFGGYLRTKARAKYAAQDFAPLAESTIEKRTQKGMRALESKLRQDVRKAVRRAGERSGDPGLLRRLFGAGSITSEVIGQQSKGAARRQKVLDEFLRRRRKGSDLKGVMGGKELSLKQLTSLGARTDRAVAKAVGAPILGKLADSLVVKVDGDSVTLTSRTGEQWSEAHNAGDTVGHGAKLPKRETIKLESEDITELTKILREHCLTALEE